MRERLEELRIPVEVLMLDCVEEGRLVLEERSFKLDLKYERIVPNVMLK